MSNLLAGGLSADDEEDVEAELDELIRADQQREINRLPDVPEHSQRNYDLILIECSLLFLFVGERVPVVSPTKVKQRVLVEAD